MVHDFAYPVTLTPDVDSGGYVVTFADVPEAITQGDSRAEALREAADALEEAVAGRIRRGEPIPPPYPAQEGQVVVLVPALTAAKAALYLALREQALTKSALAKRLGCDEKEVRRLLDPRHQSHLPRLQAALEALGKRLAVRVVSGRLWSLRVTVRRLVSRCPPLPRLRVSTYRVRSSRRREISSAVRYSVEGKTTR